MCAPLRNPFPYRSPPLATGSRNRSIKKPLLLYPSALREREQRNHVRQHTSPRKHGRISFATDHTNRRRIDPPVVLSRTCTSTPKKACQFSPTRYTCPSTLGDLRVTVASIPFSGVPLTPLPHLITLTGQSPTSSFYYYSGPLAKEGSREEKTVSQEILRNVSRVWIPALCSAIFFE